MKIRLESGPDFPSIFIYIVDDGIHNMLVKFTDDMKWRGMQIVSETEVGTENAFDKLETFWEQLHELQYVQKKSAAQQPTTAGSVENYLENILGILWMIRSTPLNSVSVVSKTNAILGCTEHYWRWNTPVNASSTEEASAKCCAQFQPLLFGKDLGQLEDSRQEWVETTAEKKNHIGGGI